ncbi:MAG: VCBS repeat-containing protein [Cyanobacteria bacterium]|nr:VCBS repeat-containing protein [Cyanobacteriota bacterium]
MKPFDSLALAQGKLAVTGIGFALVVVTLSGAPAAGPVKFEAHDIDPKLPGAYAVNTADFNNDGKLDVIANSLGARDLAWYENPAWERHVIVSDTMQIVNQAPADINGDGIPELAFQSSFAMQAAKSEGVNWIARSSGPGQPWKAEKFDTFPTSHHIVWADLDGDGKKELINAPLIGAGSLAPTYDQDKAPVFWYDQGGWKRHTMTDSVPGIIHRVRPVKWDSGNREQILVASFEGIVMYRATGSGENMKFEKVVLSKGHEEKAPRLGASDVGVGMQDGRRFFASVEPWHGNEVVIYTGSGTNFTRRVIFDKIASGHEIAVVDLNGDGRDDIVANDNARGATQNNPNAPTGGVHVFFAPDDAAKGEWQYLRLEDKLGMNSCVGVDINKDKRNDLVCGGASGVVRWYENKGK